jgi:hypothetical protein
MFRALAKVYFLQISYVVLVVVPVLATIKAQSWASFFGDLPIALRLGYLSSLLLSFAHMTYQGFCPNIIKKFDNPNELYRDLLEIKAMQVQSLPNDEQFMFSIEHCRSNFLNANYRAVAARLLCGILYAGGIGLVCWLIFERTRIVLLGPPTS